MRLCDDDVNDVTDEVTDVTARALLNDFEGRPTDATAQRISAASRLRARV